MNDEIKKAEIVKGPKWAAKEVYNFFKMLNKNSKICNCLQARRGLHEISPFRFKDCERPDLLEKHLISTDFNAYTVLDAGHVYDSFGIGKVRTDEERIEDAKKLLPKLIDEIEKTISKSDNEMFRRIGVKVLNKDFYIVRTYRDPYDDGDDYYGVELFLKFHYVK